MSEGQPFNYISIENGARIIECTSEVSNCPCKNILNHDRKAIWLSEFGLPQSFIIDISSQLKRPKFFKCFGFDCWHDYSSNPSVIELLVSAAGNDYITWTILHAQLRAGVQLFSIDPIGTKYNFIKVIIKETFGASKTYLNQVYLLEENPLKQIRSYNTNDESTYHSELSGDYKEEIDHIKKQNDFQPRISNTNTSTITASAIASAGTNNTNIDGGEGEGGGGGGRGVQKDLNKQGIIVQNLSPHSSRIQGSGGSRSVNTTHRSSQKKGFNLVEQAYLMMPKINDDDIAYVRSNNANGENENAQAIIDPTFEKNGMVASFGSQTQNFTETKGFPNRAKSVQDYDLQSGRNYDENQGQFNQKQVNQGSQTRNSNKKNVFQGFIHPPQHIQQIMPEQEYQFNISHTQNPTKPAKLGQKIVPPNETHQTKQGAMPIEGDQISILNKHQQHMQAMNENTFCNARLHELSPSQSSGIFSTHFPYNNSQLLPPNIFPMISLSSPAKPSTRVQNSNDFTGLVNIKPFDTPYLKPNMNNEVNQKANLNHILHERLTSMNSEISKLATQASKLNQENDKDLYQDDDGEPRLPLFTRSEKEVHKLQKEMEKWGGMISKLESNMANILDKVSSVEGNIHNIKKTKKEEKQEHEQEEASQKFKNKNKYHSKDINKINDNVNNKVKLNNHKLKDKGKIKEKERMIMNKDKNKDKDKEIYIDDADDNDEDNKYSNTNSSNSISLNEVGNTCNDEVKNLKMKISNECDEIIKEKLNEFFDMMKNQHEEIINENKKLKSKIEYQDDIIAGKLKDSKQYEQAEVTTQQIQKIATSIVENQITTWETTILSKIKAQNDLQEQRLNQKIIDSLEEVKLSNDSRLRAFEENLQSLAKKVENFERTNSTLATKSTKGPNDIIDDEDDNEKGLETFKDGDRYQLQQKNHKLKNNNVEIQYYQSKNTRRNEYPIREINSHKVDSMNKNKMESYNKIQILMDKLQEKISMRDKKLRELKYKDMMNSINSGSITKKKDDFDSSEDDIDDYLSNPKLNNPYYETKKRTSNKNNVHKAKYDYSYL